MKKKHTFVRSLALSIVFLAVPFAVYLKNIPRTVDFIGVLVCGFAAGVLLCSAISIRKKEEDK